MMAIFCFDFLVNGRGTFDARTHKFIFITLEINCFAVFVVDFLLRVAGCHRFLHSSPSALDV